MWEKSNEGVGREEEFRKNMEDVREAGRVRDEQGRCTENREGEERRGRV